MNSPNRARTPTVEPFRVWTRTGLTPWPRGTGCRGCTSSSAAASRPRPTYDDLLLVTLDKGGQAQEHLQYKDYPLNETQFHWQSKASTRADDRAGLRLISPREQGATPLLLVRETKKDSRNLTQPFRYLGPVEPVRHTGERPITIEWRLSTPVLPEWVRRWRTVA